MDISQLTDEELNRNVNSADAVSLRTLKRNVNTEELARQCHFDGLNASLGLQMVRSYAGDNLRLEVGFNEDNGYELARRHVQSLIPTEEKEAES